MTQEIQRMVDRIVLTVGMSHSNKRLDIVIDKQVRQLAKVIGKTPEQTEDWLIAKVNEDAREDEVA